MLKYPKRLILVVIDFVVINLAYVFALLVRFEWNVPVQYESVFLHTFLIFSIIKIIIYYGAGLYNSLWRYAGVDELIKVFLASTLGSIVCIILSAVLNQQYPRSVSLITWMVTIMLIGLVRMSYRIYRRFKIYGNIIGYHRESKNKRVLIVGAGDAGETIIRELLSDRHTDYIPAAIVDDDKWKLNKKIHGVPVKGNTEQIREVAQDENIDEIIIAMPSVSKKVLSDIVKRCHSTGCKLKTIPGIYEIINGKVTVKDIREVKIEDLLGREEIKININEISDYLKDQIVLVTGGGGSIGSELCRQIARFSPRKLVILDIYENNAYDIQNELAFNFPDLKLEVIIASVRDIGRMRQIFDEHRPAVVFHAAAHKHVPLMEDNPTEAVKNNVFGTLNTVRCADEFGVKRFVLISTDKAVNPTNVMGATKRVAEMIIQAFDKKSNTEFVAVRFGNVLGSNGSVIPLFKKQIAHGGPVTVTHPEVTRFFMTIPEASRLVIQAGAIANGGEIFVLDMGEPVKIDTLARELISLSGLEPDIDIPVVYSGLRPGEKLYEELLLAEEGLKATKHEGIFVAKPVHINYNQVMLWLKALEGSIHNSDKVKETLSSIVPIYAGGPAEDEVVAIKEDNVEKVVEFPQNSIANT